MRTGGALAGGAVFIVAAGFATTCLATTVLATTFFATICFATVFFAGILVAATAFAAVRFGTARLAVALFGAAFLAAVALRPVEATFFLAPVAAARGPAGRCLRARVLWRLVFRGAFALGRAVFFDALALAVAAARLGRPGVRPVVRLAFALAMTLLVRSPLPGKESVGCPAARLTACR